MKTFLLLITFIFASSTSFARAGGAVGDESDSDGYSSYDYGYYSPHHYYYYGTSEKAAPLMLIVFGLVTVIFVGLAFFSFAILLRHSYIKAGKKIAASKKFDQFWDEAKMQNHVRDIFPKVQAAWMSRELKDISGIVTTRFIARFQPLLNDYKRRKILNVVDEVKLEEVKIVDILDDQDNSKDSFVAYIKGSMKDFLVHESRGIAGALSDTGSQGFEDLYIFVRKEDQWLLDHIINDPETRDFKLKNHSR